MHFWKNLRVLAPPWLFPLVCLVVVGQKTEIPDELDPFLELLFETAECESVVANEAFLVVETRKCKPFTCNFPFEACMRPSQLLNEEKANQCRAIPESCLTAANGGNPVSKPSVPSSTFPPTPPSTRIIGGLSGEHGGIDGDFEEAGKDGGELETSTVHATRRPQPLSRIRPNRLQKVPICEQGIPNGRFCGFQLKYMFNKATGNCEQFWFPGCPTEDTNENLFDTPSDCVAATRSCLALPPGNYGPSNQFGGRGGQPEPQVPVNPPQPSTFIGSRPEPAGFGQGGNQFKGFMEWAGSAFGGANGGANGGGGVQPGEYGGGALGVGQGGVSQPSNLIRLITNTLKDVSTAQQGGGGNGNGAAVFTNILQQFG